jgi:hypothetical protein
MPTCTVERKRLGDFGQLQRRLRAFVAAPRHLLQPHAARRDDGDFRHGKEPVDQDEEQDDGDFKGNVRHRRTC